MKSDGLGWQVWTGVFLVRRWLIENEQGELLIVKAGYKDHWSLPGGIVDAGESPLEAAVREVKEEVDIQVDPKDLKLAMVASRHSDEFLTHQFVFLQS